MHEHFEKRMYPTVGLLCKWNKCSCDCNRATIKLVRVAYHNKVDNVVTKTGSPILAYMDMIVWLGPFFTWLVPEAATLNLLSVLATRGFHQAMLSWYLKNNISLSSALLTCVSQQSSSNNLASNICVLYFCPLVCPTVKLILTKGGHKSPKDHKPLVLVTALSGTDLPDEWSLQHQVYISTLVWVFKPKCDTDALDSAAH